MVSSAPNIYLASSPEEQFHCSYKTLSCGVAAEEVSSVHAAGENKRPRLHTRAGKHFPSLHLRSERYREVRGKRVAESGPGSPLGS